MCTYLLFVSTTSLFTHASGFFFHDGTDDIQRMTTLKISEFIVMTAVQFLLHAAERAQPD